MLGEVTADFQQVSPSEELEWVLDIEREIYRPFQTVKPARTKSLTPDLNVKTYNLYDFFQV